MTPDCRRNLACFARHLKIPDLTDNGLGRDLCVIATDGVRECLDGQHAPDGTPWAPLSEAYGEWKGRNFPGQPMAVLHHLMSDPAQVTGIVDVTPNRAQVVYGVSQEARVEASWFQEGDPAANRPPRPFWGFTDDSKARAKETLDRRFESMV